jgi:hypothetical protein
MMKGMSMANSVKGEVEFDCGGQTYLFKFGTNAQVLVEDRIGMSCAKWMQQKADQFGASDIRLIMWAGLHRHHNLSETDVGDLIDELGADKAAEVFLKAVDLATAKGNGADPSRPIATAKDRIGTHS